MSSKPSTPPITLTLTLPDPDSERPTGTLLVQRGDLARLHQFVHTRIADLTEIIADALIAFAAVEANPPAVPQTPPPASAKEARPTTERKPQAPPEPTVDIPLKKAAGPSGSATSGSPAARPTPPPIARRCRSPRC
jgi:hypothetical protein